MTWLRTHWPAIAEMCRLYFAPLTWAVTHWPVILAMACAVVSVWYLVEIGVRV